MKSAATLSSSLLISSCICHNDNHNSDNLYEKEVSGSVLSERLVKHKKRDLSDLPLPYSLHLGRIDEMLRNEEEDKEFPIITCEDYLEMDGYVDPVAATHSLYQEISWAESIERLDKCLTLDETLQICSSYRPHYHEYFVHFPAAFLPQLKRALFVGGGDSMLLHELLKYPDIEFIVGLELDQTVVRQSFKHFFTQPHFDNDKVHWWFGDAAKSLRLLPLEWYGTFDLVMVDLSETAMSISISEELTILKALALLMNSAHGILVKNERYLKELGEVFEYAVQIYIPDTPVLCDQDWVFGSNGIDFLHPDFDRLLGRYDVKTLHYRPRENTINHYNLIKQYIKNTNISLEHSTSSIQKMFEQMNKSGIFVVIDAENTTLNSKPDFQFGEFADIVAYPFIGGGQLYMITFYGGYIVAWSWPDLSYWAFDIALWEKIDRLETIKGVLLKSVGAKESASSYTVVIGGIHGTEILENNSRYVESEHSCREHGNNISQNLYQKETCSHCQIIIQESLSSIPSLSKRNIIVLCGRFGSECESLKAFTGGYRPKMMFALWSCSDQLFESFESKGIMNVSLCNRTLESALNNIYLHFGKFDLIVVDADATSINVIECAVSICADPSAILLNDKFLSIIPHLDLMGEYFLEQCRLHIKDTMLRTATVSIDNTNGLHAGYYDVVGYVAIGDPFFMSKLNDIIENTAKKTSANVALISMNSIPLQDQQEYQPSGKSILDYDDRPGMMQYQNQFPLGKQTLLQITMEDTEISNELLRKQTVTLLQAMGSYDSSQLTFHHVGSGSILYAIFNEGYMAVLWDGRNSVGLNIFTHDENYLHKELFEENFIHLFHSTARLTQWDEQPRGIKKVVNLTKDIKLPNHRGCVDQFTMCKTIVAATDCDAEKEEVRISSICPATCNACPGIF